MFAFDELVDAAETETGLSDWGKPDFLDHMRVFVDAVEAESDVRVSSRSAVRERMLIVLRARLRRIDDRKTHAGIAQETITSPMIIFGLPRAGTTFLQSLLVQDPANRSARMWETMFPSPPPEPATYDRDPRIEEVEQLFERDGFSDPVLQDMHPFLARNPEEDYYILDCAGVTSLRSYFDVPSYMRYLSTLDLNSAYADHYEMLQHLQWRMPCDRWVLKNHHDLLPGLHTYPDAKILMCHRDPAKVLPSLASLSLKLHSLYSDRVPELSPAAFARMRAKELGRLTEVLTRERDEMPERAGQFFDVNFRDSVSDPIGMVRRIYDHFGMELSDDAVRRMEHWLARDQHTKGSRHRYTLESSGLDLEFVDQCFEGYLDRYDVTLEVPR